MKKHYLFKFTLLLIPAAAFVLMSNSFGKSGGFSGSPGDSSNSCANCHGGGNFGASVSLQTEIPAGGYDLNTTYGINVDISSTSNSRHGFQVTAEKVSDGTKIGTFIVGGTDTQLTNNDGNIVQTTAGNSQKTWDFNWKSPSSNAGAVKFYVAAVAGNGSGSDGDQVVTATSTDFRILGIAEEKRLDFDMYPNPASENLTIQLPSGSDKATVQFYDYIGKLALTKEITTSNNKILVDDLSTGVYILKVVSDGKIGSQKFIKR